MQEAEQTRFSLDPVSDDPSLRVEVPWRYDVNQYGLEFASVP